MEFCASVDEFILNSKRKLHHLYIQPRLLRGLFALAKFRNNPKALKVKALKQRLYVPGGQIGYYESVKSDGQYNNDKFYMINMRNHNTDICDSREYITNEALIEHLKENFSKAGYPEYIFLVDSAFNKRLGNMYLEAGYSYAFVACTVKKDQLPCGITILTRKSWTPSLLASLTVLPYSLGYVNVQMFDKGGKFDYISLYSALSIIDSQGEYVGAFHQPAVEQIKDRTNENLHQIKAMSDASKPIKVMMMDSNKYGVNTKEYSEIQKAFKALMLNHVVYYFLPAIVNKLRGVSVNADEIQSSKSEIEEIYPDYTLINPINNSDNYAKTFHGYTGSTAEKVFANIINYCLDLAIVYRSHKWFIRHIFPRSLKYPDFFTDHSGILVEGVRKQE